MDMNQLMQTFLAESRDLLEDMERHLLEAERGESSPDAVNAIFRAAHTIKGSGGLFDLPQLVGFTHVLESVLDLVRDEALSLSSELIALLLVCCDHIHALVETAADPSHADAAALATEAEPLLAQLQTYLQGSVCGVTEAAIQLGTPEKQSGYWRISLTLFADALRFGNSPLKLIRNLRGLGSVESISTDYSQLPTFEDLDPEANYLGFQILLRSDADRAAIEEVFEFVREDCDLEITSCRHRPMLPLFSSASLQRLHRSPARSLRFRIQPRLQRRHVPPRKVPHATPRRARSVWTPTNSIA
ncbi:Hpt domain-containing protein [Xanthomonas hortorum pv. carotae]|nr:Hpt domain-containing protein [Xanthomonas hortorum pv. carotae]